MIETEEEERKNVHIEMYDNVKYHVLSHHSCLKLWKNFQTNSYNIHFVVRVHIK